MKQTSRHLRTRLNEHIPKCILRFIDEKTKIKTKAVVNATKRSSIAEHLVNSTNCANNYDPSRFKILYNCTSSMDLVRLEAITISFIKDFKQTTKLVFIRGVNKLQPAGQMWPSKLKYATWELSQKYKLQKQ